jgi:hypothetical protein
VISRPETPVACWNVQCTCTEPVAVNAGREKGAVGRIPFGSDFLASAKLSGARSFEKHYAPGNESPFATPVSERTDLSTGRLGSHQRVADELPIQQGIANW